MNREQRMSVLNLKDPKYFRQRYLSPAGLIEMTQPDSPRSLTQKYRLMQKASLVNL